MPNSLGVVVRTTVEAGRMNRLITVKTALALGAGIVADAMTTPAFTEEGWVDPFTLSLRAPARSTDRFGDLPLGAVVRTDERYGADHLFQGPRGWDYWNRLSSPKPDQNPNLWPDKRPTYLVGQMTMPAGSSITVRGKFPHARYFNVSLYKFERNTFVAVGDESLDGWDIEPDQGAANPYRVGGDRLVNNRDFTLHILAEDAPKNEADRATNTIYVGRDEQEVQLAVRVYLSDEGYDGMGWGPGDTPAAEPGFTYEGRLADGTRLSADQTAKRFGRPLGSAPPLMTDDQWYALVDAKDNDPSLTPATAPARSHPVWERFWTVPYTLVGAFKPPEMRAKMRWEGASGGGANPLTVYLVTYLSRKFGPVYVLRGKLPTFPNTFNGLPTMPKEQVVYWSVVSVASGPSGELWDGLYDMQLPLDQNGNYTIVMSRPEDRPKNATPENGVAWMNWGPGEGLNDPRNRTDWGMLIMRFIASDPNWANSPTKIAKPGEDEAVMGPYYPRGEYTDKASFETAQR
jgi:hypothetical protein